MILTTHLIVDELMSRPSDNDGPTNIVDDVDLQIDMDGEAPNEKPSNINSRSIDKRGSTLRIKNVEMNLAKYFASKTFESVLQIAQIQPSINDDAPKDFSTYRQNTMKNIKNTLSSNGIQSDNINKPAEKTDYKIKLKTAANLCCSAIMIFCMRVLMPLFALLYATLYSSESVCKDFTDYLIWPKSFLYGLAIMDLIMFLLYFWNLGATGCGENDAPEKWKYLYRFLTFLYFVLMVAGSLAGCYIFNQMSNECRKEEIVNQLIISL